MSSGFRKVIFTCFVSILLVSCSNPFAYKKHDWVQVTETGRDDYQAVYVDRNRIECDKEGNCTAWIKMIFAKEKQIPFGGNKQGQVSGYMLAKRIDSSVKYFCNLAKAQIISYQIYDKKDQLMDSKWIQGDEISLQPNTVHHDLWRYVCLKRR
tara:strand:+ start:86 stop:544 length:459 start_codon:yes stop_codon:yes gene_type:complete